MNGNKKTFSCLYYNKRIKKEFRMMFKWLDLFIIITKSETNKTPSVHKRSNYNY